MSPAVSFVDTSHARIAVADSGGRGPVVVLVHGNSSCKEVFCHQLSSALAERYRLVAFDLPGHGESENAREPDRTYSMPGYADLLVELLGKLGITEAALLGWSLGGHIGLEAISRFPGLKGLMIVGSPPVGKSRESVEKGFIPSPEMALSGKEDFSEKDVLAYARYTLAPWRPLDEHLASCTRRTDGRARRLMFEAFAAGKGDDQRMIVESSGVPLAVLNGGAEPLINIAYFPKVHYANLWEGTLFVLPGVGHAAFWEAPEIFNPIFQRFLASVLG